jgi:hypothetical protein
MKTRRKELTPEQKAAAAERRARFTELAKRIAALSDDERSAIVAKCGAVVTIEGRALSIHNSCMVLSQLPTASVVGGFQQWRDHGRKVRKGATGIAIWIPAKGTKADAEPTAADVSAEGADKDGRPRFFSGYVFDVSATESADGTADAPGAHPDAPPTCRACGCTSDDGATCSVCGSALIPC